MPIHFARLPPELADAALYEPLITPNERLAREAAAACNQRQIDRGCSAWPKPRTQSLRRYLRGCFDAAETGVEVLSAEAELLLWRDEAQADSLHLAELAAEAWALALLWRIDMEAPAFAETANGRLFQRWAARFRAQLNANNWVTEAQLADLATAGQDSLHLLGFERIEPQITDFLRRVERAGGRIHHHAPAESTAASEVRVGLDSRADEISAAAQWARQMLAADEDARIGVVFPYLTDAYHAIDHAFGVEFADAREAFDISGGLPLAQQPVWRSADALLAHLMEPADGTPGPLSTSPFLELSDLPTGSDNPLEPGWADNQQPFGTWVATFHRILRQANWGANAGSVQYQALQGVRERLDHYSQLAQRPQIDAAEALQTLRDLLGAQDFAPERRPAPIQVLGYLETTGLQFSHLWVAGLSDSSWPANPSPNPLIPMALQKRCGVPRIDHQSEGEFARQRMQHWRNACRSFIASWPQEDTDGPHGCSALIKPLREIPVSEAIAGHRRRHHPWLTSLPPIESEAAAPDRATPFEAEIRKGTAVIRDQAQCPFRAWAIHRLGLTADDRPEPFADAMTRGIVVHDAFFALYQNHERPFSADDIDDAVEATLEQHLKNTPALFRAHENNRIAAILNAWIKHEAKRPEFTVVGLEQEAELRLPGAQFNLRIDRIDQDRGSGAKIVIDYKTGVLSVNRLVGDRLTEPQLPMYALTDADIQAVLFAKVGDEAVRLDGWSDDGLRPGKSPEGGWERLRERWQTQIESLIEEFRTGEAAVMPHDPQVCRYCHLPSLCRINAFEAAP